MYLSDYLYASSYYNSSNTEIANGKSYYFGNNNWLYKGPEWTLTPYDVDHIWRVVSGTVYGVYTRIPSSARPSFYLKSTVSILGGDGSFANPYQIE